MTDRAKIPISQPAFRPFDELAPVRIYRHAFLPHLRQKESSKGRFVVRAIRACEPGYHLIEFKPERGLRLEATTTKP